MIQLTKEIQKSGIKISREKLIELIKKSPTKEFPVTQ
jgi:hypothetical protein